MSEIELKEDWPVEKTKKRIEEIKEELEWVHSENSRTDKKIRMLEGKLKKARKRKEFLARKESNNVRYKNAMINELIEKGEWYK